MITKRQFDIEKLEDTKKILVKVYIEDELTPEDVLKKLEESQKLIVQLQADIDAIPEQVEVRTKQLTEQRDFIREEILKFQGIESYAKLWKKENELVAERTGKEEEKNE